MKILNTVFNSYMVNTYLCVTDNNNAIMIDAAFSNDEEWAIMKSKINELHLNLKMVLLTHSHADHIIGLAMLKKDFPEVQIVAHKESLSWYQSVNDFAILMGFDKQNIPPIDRYIDDNELIKIDDEEIEVRHTPGHTEGCTCYYLPKEDVVFTGDTLFRASVGRTDLAGGNFDLLTQSIKSKLYILPENTLVLPGHGEATDIAYEKNNNPFVKY